MFWSIFKAINSSDKTDRTEETNGQTETIQKVRIVPDPSESTVHGKEVHVSKSKQVQKEKIGDKEITRKITATETTEMEHKGTPSRIDWSNFLLTSAIVFQVQLKNVW